MRTINDITIELEALEAEMQNLNDRIDAMDGTEPEIDQLLAMQEQLEREHGILEDELNETYDLEMEYELNYYRYQNAL